MKKRIIPIITCLIVLLLFSSCDGSLTQNLNKFLNIANGNVFINSGLIKVDLSAVNNVVNTITEVKPTTKEETKDETTGITTTKKESGETKLEIDDNQYNSNAKISVGNIEIEVAKEDVKDIDSFTPPMTSSELGSLNTELNEVLSSEKKSEEFVQKLAQPAPDKSATAAKGTFALTAAVAKKAAANTSATNEQKALLNSLAEMATKSAKAESTTAADVLTAKLVMGVVTQMSKIADSTATDADKNAAKSSIIDQASTLITISKKQIGSFDILALDGLDSLLSSINSKSLSSREVEASYDYYWFVNQTIIDEVTKYRPMIYSALVNLYSFNGQSFDATKEQVLVNSYKSFYTANLAILNYGDKDAINKLKVDDLLKMVTSVLIMQLDGVNTKVLGFDSISKLLNDLFTLNPWILKNSNGSFPTLTTDNVVKLPKYLEALVPNVTEDTFNLNNYINDDKGIINETNLYAQLNALDLMMTKTGLTIPNMNKFDFTDELDKILNKNK